MTSSHSRGSEWRKWDLHIHSPLSAMNNQFPRLGDGAPDWDAYVRKLESLTDTSAVGITDYFTIEGYRKVLEFKKAGRLQNIELIIPDIEFRLDKIISTSNGNRRLNYHVVFSNQVSPEEIEEHFLQELKFVYQGDPQRTDLSWSVRRTNLELLGKRLKAEHREFAESGRSDFEIGCMNATIDSARIKEILENKSPIFRGKYLIILAEQDLSLLDWDDQAHHTRKTLLQGSDMIFSSNPKTISWARGEGDLLPDQFKREFRSLKPCVHGCDAHRLEDIGRPEGHRFCWIKAERTFEGLRQILYEPFDRVFIGEAPSRLKNDYQVIDSIRIADASDWFSDDWIPLNEDLAAVIGPRGSGKSALAEILAFGGGADIFRDPRNLEDSFLHKASQKSPVNPRPIVGGTITIRWKDGTVDGPITIPSGLHHNLEDEKVKYLPQRFVERLTAPENTRQLEEEIERVIFERMDKTEKLEASNFQELREIATRAIAMKRNMLAQTILSLNQSIATATARIAMRPPKEAELSRRRAELEALLKNEPKVPEQNKEELTRLEELLKQRQSVESEIVGLTSQITSLDTLDASFQVFEQDIARFNERVRNLLEGVGLGSELPRFVVQLPAGIREVLTDRRSAITKSIEALRKGGEGAISPERNLDSLDKQINDIRTRSKLTDAKRKEHEKFQKDRKQLEDAISSLERECKEIDEVIVPQRKIEDATRTERYLDSISLLKEEKDILDRLYEPLRTALLSSNDTAKKLTFASKIILDVAEHAERGEDLLDRRKSVYAEAGELEQTLRQFFVRIEEAAFARDKVREELERLRASFLQRGNEKIRIEEQLRKNRTPKDFADWLYSVEHYSVVYSIKFDGKDLEFLSPGEKGIVLLLLYLEAETVDNRPLIIDQPDDNIDNVSVYPTLVEYFRARKKTRQIIVITHNPNLVVNTDAEHVFVARFDGTKRPKISYRAGAIEDTSPTEPPFGIREEACKILEGGTEAFQRRERRYSYS